MTSDGFNFRINYYSSSRAERETERNIEKMREKKITNDDGSSDDDENEEEDFICHCCFLIIRKRLTGMSRRLEHWEEISFFIYVMMMWYIRFLWWNE